MKRCLRLLLCLPLLATTACAADAIAGPELAPEPHPVRQEAVQAAAAVREPLPRIVIPRLKDPASPAEPLCIIDGVPALSADARARMEADDIESIEVIKGDALSALYGNRLLAGVVIITTRHAAVRRQR